MTKPLANPPSAGAWNRRNLRQRRGDHSCARILSIAVQFRGHGQRRALLRIARLVRMYCCSSPMADPTNRWSSPGGIIPPHETRGAGHLAFAISIDALEAWRLRLREREIALESEVQWDRGGTSLFFRDPDANLLELATPGVWPNH